MRAAEPPAASAGSPVPGGSEHVVTVYTVARCLDCAAVKNLLAEAGIPFREVDISSIPHARDALQMLSGIETMPQVFVGSRFIGQVAEVRYLVRTGQMARLIADALEEKGIEKPAAD